MSANRWRLRPEYFKGAGRFTFEFVPDQGPPESVTVDIDGERYFTLPKSVTFPIYGYATADPQPS
jgi:hypothetical protein